MTTGTRSPALYFFKFNPEQNSYNFNHTSLEKKITILHCVLIDTGKCVTNTDLKKSLLLGTTDVLILFPRDSWFEF